MKNKFSLLLYTLFAAFVLVQCAKRGNPTGGPVDEKAPEILREFPDNYSTSFKNQTITIVFDEYVTFKDITKQLVISPPLKTTPIITPQGGAAREIEITITDTLKDNTTYVLNFGQSIVDNNEGNPYPFYKYVFSTGTYIDSLTLKGKVTNALEFETADFVNVMLYEIDSTYTDSAIYKETPNYVLNTLDSLNTFTLENLKEGTYRMVALKEENSDLRFDPKRDLIGFISEDIQVPTDASYEIKLYQQLLDHNLKRPTHEAKNRIHVGYTGELDGLNIKAADKSLIKKSRITKLDKKDTLQYWFEPLKSLDSILIKGSWNDYEDEFMVRLKDLKKDSLQVSKYGEFKLRTDIELTATTPMERLDPSKMVLIDKDSTAVNFTTRLDSLLNVATVVFDKNENQRYELQLYPGAITDFYGETHADTLKLKYSTRAIRDYGNILIDVQGAGPFPVIVQIVSTDLKVIAQQVARASGIYEFLLIDPASYYIRVIYDTNDNGKYDPGNYLKNRQPERVQYFPEQVRLQPNWEVNEIIKLK